MTISPLQLKVQNRFALQSKLQIRFVLQSKLRIRFFCVSGAIFCSLHGRRQVAIKGVPRAGTTNFNKSAAQRGHFLAVFGRGISEGEAI